MSPTYRTASQIISAAQANGFEITPRDNVSGAWGVKKGRYRATVAERRDGGLCWMYLRYPMYSGMNVDYYSPRNKGKLETLLKFINDCENWRGHRY